MLQWTSVSVASCDTIALVPPASSGERSGQNEDGELVARGPVAEGDCARLVIADGLENLAEGRMNDPVDKEEADQEDRGNEVIEAAVVIEVDEAERRAAWNGLNAILSARKGRLQRKEIAHLREREGDHGEIDA